MTTLNKDRLITLIKQDRIKDDSAEFAEIELSIDKTKFKGWCYNQKERWWTDFYPVVGKGGIQKYRKIKPEETHLLKKIKLECL